MSLNHRIHAVVFDMDGVLVDSEPLQYRACQEMVAQVELELTEEAFRQKWVGHKTIDSLTEMLEEHRIEADAEALMEFKHSAYHHLISTEPIVPRPGILWLLDWLRERNIPCTVASSSNHADIRLVLKRLALAGYFLHLTSSEDCTLPKPDPEIYSLSARKLGLKPGFCLAIEDSSIGMRAAKSAGMYCVAFPHRYTADQDFDAADGILQDIREISRMFAFTSA